jgi:nitroreductase
MDKTQAKETLLAAHHFRHACKQFDPDQIIPPEDLDFILGCARLSPSSFGMQGWRLHIVTDAALKATIKKACWNQPQIDTCSHLLILTTRTADLEPGSPWVKSRFADRQMPEDQQQAYYDRYDRFQTNLRDRLEGRFKRQMVGLFYRLFHKNRTPKDLYQWGARQCYIVLGNAMTAAAAIGIDSCPIEGMDKNAIEQILKLDTAEEEVAVLCPMGYRARASQPPRHRLSLDTIVTRH